MIDRSGQETDLSAGGVPVPARGDLVAGKYRIEGTLGEGGMGVVLAARHEALGQAVAIKFLIVRDEQYRAEASERLLREARAVAALRGEHVVRVFDVGETTEGLPFIVMERLEGFDLGRLTHQGRRLPGSVACNLVQQACRAVHEAHQAGIVHRDLKPSNLFAVRRADNRVLLKVLDFGISKSLHQPAGAPITLTGEKVALGSPHYMSPEQVRDARAVDTRTDVWSLGVILYELIAGHPVFQANSYPGLYAAIVSDSPPSLAQLRPEVSPELAAWVARCLERDPSRRLQTAAELANGLAGLTARDVDYDYLADLAESDSLLGPVLTQSGTQSTQLSIEPPPDSPPAAVLEHHTRTQVSEGALALAPALRKPPRSASPATERSPSRPGNEPASAVFRRGRVALVAVSIFVALAWRLQHPATPESTHDQGVVPATWVGFESRPSGATVTEKGRSIGVTPLRLPLPASSAGEQRHVFVLELEGYRPYVVEHVARAENLVIHAELVAEPPARAPSASAHVPMAPRVQPAMQPTRHTPPSPTGSGSSRPPAAEIRPNR